MNRTTNGIPGDEEHDIRQNGQQRNGDDDRPLQLFDFKQPENPEAETEIKLNEATINKIVRDCGNRPLYIVSIVGPTREGKSFTLNFMLRYLSAMENGVADWMSWEDPTKLLEGFDFQRGTDPVTRGILVWNKPFLIKNPEGREMAVLLLDTQGLDAECTTPRDKSWIVSLSLFASSVTIINSMKVLKEEFFNVMHPFTEYGLLAKEKQPETGHPFQNLSFLIREWNNSDDFPYGGEGGRQFLEKKLGIIQNQTKEAKAARKAMLHCFDKLGCFLLPPIERKTPHRNLEEMSAPFAKKLEEFVNSLFRENALLNKRILGREITAMELKSFLETYAEIFKSDTVPSAENILEAIRRYDHGTGDKLKVLSMKSDAKEKLQNPIPESNQDIQKTPGLDRMEAERKNQTQEVTEMAFIELIKEAIAKVFAWSSPAAERWIETEMTTRNISEFRIIYTKQVDECLRSHYYSRVKQLLPSDQPATPPNIQAFWQRFTHVVKSSCEWVCVRELEIIFQPLKTFNGLMQQYFIKHGCVSCDQIDGVLMNIIQYCKTQFQLENSATFQGVSKLAKLYTSYNAEVFRREEILALKLQNKVKTFYEDEMGRFLREKVFTSKDLRHIHALFVERILDKFKQSFQQFYTFPDRQHQIFSYLPQPVEKFKNDLQELLNFLLTAKEKELTQKKLKVVKEIVQRIVNDCKLGYAHGMKMKLIGYSRGVEPSALASMNEDIQTEMLTSLKEKIEKEISKNEPTDGYCKALKWHMDDCFSSFERENNEKKLITNADAGRPLRSALGVRQKGSAPTNPTEAASTSRLSEPQPSLLPPTTLPQSNFRNSHLEILKKELQRKCEDMEAQLNSGGFDLKTDYTKTLIKEKIKVSREAVNNGTVEEMQKLIDILDKTSLKHGKQ